MKRTAMALMFVAAAARGDAWPRGAGTAYVHLGLGAAEATRAFDVTGENVPIPGRGGSSHRATLYVEAGLGNRWTITASAPYQRIVSRGFFNDFSTAGFADLDLRLRFSHRLRRGVVAVEGGAFIPLGYGRMAFPQLGSGRVDPVVNVAWGSSIASLPGGFASLQAGYRGRAGGLTNELPYSVKIGAFPHPRIGTFAFARGWESRADFAAVDPAYGFTLADSERLAAGIEIYLRLTAAFDANASCERVLRGRNTPATSECAIGVAFTLK